MRRLAGTLWVWIGIAVALNLFLWHQALLFVPGTMTVSVLNIGQGDSILVQGPTGIRMLVDGGPDQSVLRALPPEIGLFAQRINMVVETHPDKDHIAGLVDVFSQYRVASFLEPGIPDGTAAFHAVQGAVRAEPGLQTFIARRGMRIHLGGGAYADVLYPDRDMSRETVTNEGSVTMHVVYGNTSFMLTGDLPSNVEEYLVALDKNDGELKTDVLKAGHHGSKFSTGDAWLAALHPTVVAISAGKGNSYGHPNPDALARIRNEGAQIVSTIDHGTLDFISDGRKIQERFAR